MSILKFCDSKFPSSSTLRCIWESSCGQRGRAARTGQWHAKWRSAQCAESATAVPLQRTSKHPFLATCRQDLQSSRQSIEMAPSASHLALAFWLLLSTYHRLVSRAQANLFSAFAQNSFFGKFAFQTSQATVIWSAWCRTILRDNTSSLEIQARSKKCRLHWHDGKKPWCGFRHLRNFRTVVANSSATWAVASDLPRLSPGYATWLHAISSAAQWLMLARVVLGHFSPSLSYPLSDSETCVAWSHNNNEVRHLLSWRALQTRIQHLLRQRIAILLFFDPGSAWTCLPNQPLEHTTMLPIPATSPSYLHQAFHSSVGKKFCQIHILAYLCAQLHA